MVGPDSFAVILGRIGAAQGFDCQFAEPQGCR
jgi:hypothetical protein